MKKPPRKRAPRSTHPTVAPAAPREIDALFERVVTILEDARARVVRSVNGEMILAYWHIGREIVESVQRGQQRAEYGEAVLETLSGKLTGASGAASRPRIFGISACSIWRTPTGGRRFITRLVMNLARSPPRFITSHVMFPPTSPVSRASRMRRAASSRLSWTHYRVLTKVPNAAERLFYEIEADRDGWSTTVLERQVLRERQSIEAQREREGA